MSAIKPDDLVAITRPAPCCGRTASIGKIFTVAEVCRTLGRCDCGAVYEATVASDAHGSLTGFVASRLTRIDPLKEDEPTTTEEELHA